MDEIYHDWKTDFNAAGTGYITPRKTYIEGHGMVELADYSKKTYIAGFGWVDNTDLAKPKTYVGGSLGFVDLKNFRTAAVTLPTHNVAYLGSGQVDVTGINRISIDPVKSIAHTFSNTYDGMTAALSPLVSSYLPANSAIACGIISDSVKSITGDFASIYHGITSSLNHINADGAYQVIAHPLKSLTGTLSGAYSDSGVTLNTSASSFMQNHGIHNNSATGIFVDPLKSLTGTLSGVYSDCGVMLNTSASSFMQNHGIHSNSATGIFVDPLKSLTGTLSGVYGNSGIAFNTSVSSFMQNHGIKADNVFNVIADPMKSLSHTLAGAYGESCNTINAAAIYSNTHQHISGLGIVTIDPMKPVMPSVTGAYVMGNDITKHQFDSGRIGIYSDLGIAKSGSLVYHDYDHSSIQIPEIIPTYKNPSTSSHVKINYTLARKLARIHACLEESYQGAVHVLNGRGPDYVVHMACSLRRTLTYVVEKLPNKTSLTDFFQRNIEKFADKKYGKPGADRNNSRIAFLFFTDKNPGLLTDDEFMFLIATCNLWLHEYREQPEFEQALDVYNRAVAILLHILEAHETVNN